MSTRRCAHGVVLRRDPDRYIARLPAVDVTSRPYLAQDLCPQCSCAGSTCGRPAVRSASRARAARRASAASNANADCPRRLCRWPRARRRWPRAHKSPRACRSVPAAPQPPSLPSPPVPRPVRRPSPLPIMASASEKVVVLGGGGASGVSRQVSASRRLLPSRPPRSREADLASLALSSSQSLAARPPSFSPSAAMTSRSSRAISRSTSSRRASPRRGL